MKVLFDECMPHPLRRLLNDLEISTVQEMGWRHFKNGRLLALAEGKFDVFLTADGELKYQQNLTGRKLAIVIVPTNRLPYLRNKAADIEAAIQRAREGDYIELTF